MHGTAVFSPEQHRLNSHCVESLSGRHCCRCCCCWCRCRCRRRHCCRRCYRCCYCCCCATAAGLSGTSDLSVRDSARNTSLDGANRPRVHRRAYTNAANAISHSWYRGARIMDRHTPHEPPQVAIVALRVSPRALMLSPMGDRVSPRPSARCRH